MTQNGPAFFERTLRTRSASLGKPDLADIEAKGLHGLIELHHMIERELVAMGPRSDWAGE